MHFCKTMTKKVKHVLTFEEMIKDSKTGNDIISGKEISLENKLNVEGKSSMIIELN